MTGTRFISGPFVAAPAIVAVALFATGCTSRDQRAADAAAVAGDAFQQGEIVLARRQIDVALRARDDVSDYWLLSAHIALAEQNFGGAFDAYENVLTLDRSNLEALTRLCQLALSANAPIRAEEYADQLLTLHPNDKTAITTKAGAALKRGDKQRAKQLLDQALAIDPTDALALIVKSQLLSADEDYAGAARVAEESLAAPGDPGGRLDVLKGIYLKTRDAEGYRRTIARLARAYPRSAAAQLDYARSLYDAGDAAGGLAVARRVLALSPNDVGAASAVLDLWVAQGAAAMPPGAIVAGAAGGSLETRAAYAQYASLTGHPDLALEILGTDAERDAASAVNANAKAARAYARALLGQRDAATAEIAAVLAVDEDQPRALLARGLLRANAGDRQEAIEDLRHALAGDASNAPARLMLADLQRGGGDGVLAIATLQDGVDDPGADPRIATRLAALLRAQGRAAEAAGVMETYARANPFAPKPRG